MYVQNNPVNWVDPWGLERKPGKTPPTRWPQLPDGIIKKPKWNPEGYWEGKGGKGKITWDDRSHGAGVDRGDGPQGGHWDDECSGNRWDEEGNLLPGSPDSDSNPQFNIDPAIPTAVGVGGGITAIIIWILSGGTYSPAS